MSQRIGLCAQRYLQRVAVVALGLIALLSATQVIAWDAGPSKCIHDECTGGATDPGDGVPDTRPQYGDSVLPIETCPDGQEWYGSGCYYKCPQGWHRTAVCTCKKDGTPDWDISSLSTNCSTFGY